MKKFGAIMFAAIVGSSLTIGVFLIMDKGGRRNIKIEHVSKPAISGVAFTKNDKGDIIPPDFTDISQKVMPAVVHIKSTQLQYANNYQYRGNSDLFRHFFDDDIFRHFFIWPDFLLFQ